MIQGQTNKICDHQLRPLNAIIQAFIIQDKTASTCHSTWCVCPRRIFSGSDNCHVSLTSTFYINGRWAGNTRRTSTHYTLGEGLCGWRNDTYKYWENHFMTFPTEYRKISNIRCTKSPNLNVSRLFLQLSLPNSMKPGVKSSMKM